MLRLPPNWPDLLLSRMNHFSLVESYYWKITGCYWHARSDVVDDEFDRQAVDGILFIVHSSHAFTAQFSIQCYHWKPWLIINESTDCILTSRTVLWFTIICCWTEIDFITQHINQLLPIHTQSPKFPENTEWIVKPQQQIFIDEMDWSGNNFLWQPQMFFLAESNNSELIELFIWSIFDVCTRVTLDCLINVAEMLVTI